MEKAVFYYRSNEEKSIAYTETEFIKLIQNETIKPTDEIWMTKLQDWIKLEDSIYCFYMKKAALEISDISFETTNINISDEEAE